VVKRIRHLGCLRKEKHEKKMAQILVSEKTQKEEALPGDFSRQDNIHRGSHKIP